MGLVQSTLDDDGYPKLVDIWQGNRYESQSLGGESLSYLFDDSEHAGKESYMDVGGLLQVDDDGYYSYDSTTNFATFDKSDNSFTVYGEPAVSLQDDNQYRDQGEFFPFSGDFVASKLQSSWGWGVDPITGITSNSATSDGSNGSQLDGHFGVHMST